jgi:hypothetical protein
MRWILRVLAVFLSVGSSPGGSAAQPTLASVEDQSCDYCGDFSDRSVAGPIRTSWQPGRGYADNSATSPIAERWQSQQTGEPEQRCPVAQGCVVVNVRR